MCEMSQPCTGNAFNIFVEGFFIIKKLFFVRIEWIKSVVSKGGMKVESMFCDPQAEERKRVWSMTEEEQRAVGRHFADAFGVKQGTSIGEDGIEGSEGNKL